MKQKKKKYNPLKKYAKGGKSTGESIRAGQGAVQEEKSYFTPKAFEAKKSESSNPLSKLMGGGKEGKSSSGSKGGSGGGDTEGLLKALGAFSKGGKMKKYKKAKR